MPLFQKATCIKRTIVPLYMILFLQAFTLCSQSKNEDPLSLSSIIEKNVSEKGSLVNRNTKRFIPIFQSELNSNPNHSTNYKPTNNFNNDSGYSSNNKSNAQPKPEEIDFKKEIEKMREKADERRHVAWSLSKDKLIRTVSKYCNSVYAPEDYGVIVLNIYRAAKKSVNYTRKIT